MKKDIEIAIRKNKGRRIFNDWIIAISKACHIKFSESDFLPLEETERLKDSFYKRVKEMSCRYCCNRSNESLGRLEGMLAIVSNTVKELGMILFSREDKFIGAVQLPARVALVNAFDIWKVTGEDFAITTSDLKHGLCLEENYYSTDGEYVKEGCYELTSWGACVVDQTMIKAIRNSGDTLLNSDKERKESRGESEQGPKGAEEEGKKGGGK